MSEVTKKFHIALDIKRSTSNREFEVVEGDTGNILDVTLSDDGVAIDLTDCLVYAVFSKSDGQTAMQSTDGSGISVYGASHNQLEITLYPTSFTPGMVECEIQVYSGADHGTLSTSAKFNFFCRRGIANEDTLQATAEWPILTSLINDVQVLDDALSESEAIRSQAESQRVTAESGRVSAESGRVTAEQARVLQEAARETAFTHSLVYEAYNAAKAYVPQNKVTYQGSSYLCITANTGHVPTDSAYWLLIAAKGDPGNNATPHASQHATNGSDPINATAIGAEPAGSISTHNANESAHSALFTRKANKSAEKSATLLSSGWTGSGPYTQTVTVSGITATDRPIIDVLLSPTAETAVSELAAWGLVSKIETGANSITATCLGSAPNISLNLQIKVVG